MASRPLLAVNTSFETNSSPPCSLQEAFMRFRRQKQAQLRQQKAAEEHAWAERRSEAAMATLRQRFLGTAIAYTGVPYAQKYHEPESPTYHAGLFLDCCGLVRRILRDLKEDFGFTIGPWNQAYLYDTLPVALSGPEEMQGGDLVFVSGVYNNPKVNPQKHDIVHVEIWLGEGEKTLGARWQKGRVQVHDSYQFSAKSYHSMQYHFRSIDTWLMGECKSYCPEHRWELERRLFDPGRFSVFALEEDEACSPPDSDSEGSCSSLDIDCDYSPAGIQLPVGTGVSEGPHPGTDPASSHPTHPSESSPLPTATGGSRRRSSLPKPARASRSAKPTLVRSVRSFVICGGNAAPLVQHALSVRGWQRLADSSSVAFTLKWVELKQHINYRSFREGEQIVNHFPNINLLTTKIGLLESLRTYDRTHRPSMRMESFVPLTYRMDVPAEKEYFLKNYREGELWICKPTGANQGKGIFIVRELSELMSKLEADQRDCRMGSRPTARVVQKYLSSPLLLEGRKFDIRVYLLIIAAQPFLALYHEGYIRLCCMEYDPASPDMTIHLTNQYQQKKHPLYSERKEDTVWDFGRFQSYLSLHLHLPEDWVTTTLTRWMQSIMTTCFNSVRHKLNSRIGFFDLLGFDFMLDADLNVWLIEVNINPAMHTNCETLRVIVPTIIEETLDLAIEVFDKCRRSKSVLPLSTLRTFTPLVTQ